MSTRPSGPILFAGGQPVTPEVFSFGEIRLMVRNAERGWAGGRVTVCLWEGEEGFPWRGRLARRMAVIDPSEGQKSVVFMGLRPGRYAVTGFADRHASGRLHQTLFGWPAAPVFLDKSMHWRRKMRFADYAQRITQSTILDLKLAHAELHFGTKSNGGKNVLSNSRTGQNAINAGTRSRPAAPAHRR